MCYTDAMKQETTNTTSKANNKEELLNIVAAKWRLLNDRQRAEWEEVSRQDKVRCVSLSLYRVPLYMYHQSHE
jgi:hypothetical protein